MSDLSDDDEAAAAAIEVVQVAEVDNDYPIPGAEEPADGDDDDGDDDDDDDVDIGQEAVAMVVEDEDDNDDEDDEDEVEEVVAAADEEDDEDEDETLDVQTQVLAMEVEEEVAGPEVEVEAVAIEEPPLKKSKPAAAAFKTSRPNRSKSPKKTIPAVAVAAPTRVVAKGMKESAPATKSKKRKPGGGKSPVDPPSQISRVDPKRMNAANLARELLYETVPRLPFPLSDQYIVRSFGQLKVGNSSSRFSSKNALYPVGFSCDRYEFSPVHGRILKLRCAILDGKRIGVEGPVFRVMWGQGVDEDVDKVEYPYDPFSNSAPIVGGGKDDVVAVPTSAGYHPPVEQVVPTPGMRVRSRFSKEKYYHGTITSVKEKDADKGSASKGKKKKKKVVHLKIRYDDGSTEETVFPDPEITLVMPGNDDEVDERGSIELAELNGKPVHTTIGRTALEAWSRALIKLGLVDEVIVELAMEAVKKARDDSSDPKKSHKGDDEGKNDADSFQGEDDNSEGLDSDAEPCSDLEKSLREKVARLKADYSEARKADKAATNALADARMLLMSPFLCNPFPDVEGSAAHQASWMATAVRKEKSKMGSTGNKRKIVTASDLLERNDTFVNGDVEALVEGLPGSEYCSEYVFLKKRGAKEVNKAVVQEQQQKQQKLMKEKENVKQKQDEVKQKQDQLKQEQLAEREKARIMKLTEEAKARASLLYEKEAKRKIREDERDARKRQKMEEEDEKKRQRAEERLARLDLQVDDRLYNEANFQREKVVVILAKNLSREMARRRRAAELVAGQVVAETKPKRIKTTNLPELPPLGKEYDEDILRIWDFLTTFSKYFVDRKFFEKPPSLDVLQSAIDALRGKSTTVFNKYKAVAFVTKLAVAMCTPLTGGLTRMLFASLIALNPTLQKEFNAAFFNEATAAKAKEEGTDTAFSTNVLLPVDEMTWTEIARIAFLSDALGELGYSRQETAHFIRGYRSVGHPNSKEAKRLRKVEDFPIALLRQSFAECLVKNNGVYARNKISVNVPSYPQSDPFDWVFYLHNVKSLKETQGDKIRINLQKCVELFEQRRKLDDSIAQYAPDLQHCVRLVGSGEASEGTSVKKCRSLALNILDKVTGDVFSRDRIGQVVIRDVLTEMPRLGVLEAAKTSQLRPRMGELEKLGLTKSKMKELVRFREQYMSDAIVLKEEMKRQELKEAGEDDDDDDDDDDEEEEQDGNNGKTQNSFPVQEAEPIEATDVNGEAKDVHTIEKAPDANDEKHGDSEVISMSQKTELGPSKIGKETEHDDFCGDIPSAPELIRRCLAVLRTLTQTGPAEAFLFPVDPQTNPGYYDMLIRPMCLREAGLKLQTAAKRCGELQGNETFEFEEATVANFARDIRLIGRNCIAYTNAGPLVVCAGAEMLRIFERLLLDWVLAPEDKLAKLDMLDDDLCVDPHPSDLESTVLLCDGCEGNFNISRLDPPMKDIPKGDWYCPRCLSGRWWGDLDPRVGKSVTVESDGKKLLGTVTKCYFAHPEEKGQSLLYKLESSDGTINVLPLDEIDEALASGGHAIPRIRCLEAVTESIGYGSGIDHCYRADLVPVLVNPNVADGAAQVSLSSSVFRDSLSTAMSLVNMNPEEMSASEWLRLLTLLLMKCSSSDIIQSIATEMENDQAEKLAKDVELISKISDFPQALPRLPFDDYVQPEMPNQSHDCNRAGPPNGDLINSNKHKNGKGAEQLIGKRSDEMEDSKAVFVSSGDKAAGKQRADEEPVVVEANAVQVVAMEVEGVPSTTNVAFVEADTANSEEDEVKASRALALAEKGMRQKLRDDGVTAFCIKNQIRSTVASFEQDNFSSVVETSLATKESGLSFSSTRCRGKVCDFCGLSDTALGANLVRVPDATEWDDLIKYAIRSRCTQLIADLRGDGETATLSRTKKVLKITIRVGDELVSDEPDEEYFADIKDGGMIEFLPRNPDGFQDELLFRYESGLPFVSGSMTAHESCAIAAHNARKVQVVERFKEQQALVAEREAGIKCGRTLEIGMDDVGRSYWHFHADPESLFVAQSSADSESGVQWQKYSDPEAICSVIVSLGKDPVAQELMSTFPKAEAMIHNRSWPELLLKRHFRLDSQEEEAAYKERISDPEDLYEEGEDVLVESKGEKMLWDAKIVGVAKADETTKKTAYRVSYIGWSSRFDDWVEADRVVEPNENNRTVQEEMWNDAMSARDSVPPALEFLEAKSFFNARDRVRGYTLLPNFVQVARTRPHASSNEKIFATMKAASLAIEAALPIGCVDNTEKGPWSPSLASQWRLKVLQSEGPWDLMRCVLLLEESISEEWIRPEMGNLRACLPGRMKALEEATSSSLAMRILLLDRALVYQTVDKKKFKSSKSKK